MGEENVARFDDEQDIYTRRTRRDEYDVELEPPAHQTEHMRPVRTSRQTDHVPAQRPPAQQRNAQRSASPRTSRAPQSARQRVEYERYGRVKPSRENTRLPRIERVPRPFHTDENPDVPKVRRASLFQDDAPSRRTPNTPLPQQRSQSSQHTPIVPPVKTPVTAHAPVIQLGSDFEDEEYEEDEINEVAEEQYEAQPAHPVRHHDTRATRPTRAIPYDDDEPQLRPVRRPYTPPDDIEDVPVRRTYGARNIHTPTVPQKAYVRRGRHEHTAYTHRSYTLLDIVQTIRHNRPLLILLSVALVALVLLPVLINSITHNSNPSSGTIYGNGTSNGSQNGSGQTVSQYPVDPHELVITVPDTAHPTPPVLATSAYLLDADTGATLYAYNPFMHLPMMSTTKLMTATLAIEHGNLDQRITISGNIANDLKQLSADSSVMGIKKGETYTLRELMYGLFLVSGNDAAIAIGDAIGGNLPNFVAMMNQRAQQLGLHDTHYMNPHGLLADNHYSSAHDLAILGRFAFNIPQLQQIGDTRVYTIPQTSDHPKHVLINGDQFLWWYPGVNAGKPGWDGDSNFVQVVSVVRNGHHLIGVTMHTANWWTDMRDLMNWGFNSFQWVSPALSDKQSPIPYDNLWNYFSDDKQSNTIPTANGGRYYVYTGYTISGPIMNYFDRNGGLNKFGYPTGLLAASGGNAVSQTFQHATIQCNVGSNQCGMV